MLNYHLPVPSVLALALTLTSACNPEAVVIPGPKDAGPGGSGMMANSPTGSTGSTPTVGGGLMDAGLSPGSVVHADAGSVGGDASAADSGASSVAPGGDGGLDAGTGRDAGADGAVACAINDRRFGCGTRLSVDWIHFASGLDIDTKYGRAWSPVVAASSFQALRAACGALVISQVTNFDAPEIDDVRTLAAGCAATLPGGTCAVQSGAVLPSQSGSCTCPGGVGPNQGKFCRVEVPDCETLWTLTECGGTNAECATTSSWFYDVRTGSVVISTAAQPIAQEAKVRCVAPITYRGP